MKRIVVLVVLIALLVGGVLVYRQRSAQPTTMLLTAPVQRGDLRITISATGTVEPIEVVDVGAQVAGRIVAFGQDPRDSSKVIDYGTEVEEGTILARIDDSLYAADVVQATAQVEQARANVRRAEAELAQMKAKLFQAENDWKRAQTLGPSRALAASEYDAYRAAYEIAQATVGVGEASVLQAQKNVVQAEATLHRAQTNLGYCIIKSPVKGVIIDRRVNIGQTVVASLNAPSLFLIAKDLRKMQVWVAVNEADIGSIRPEQPVTFTVDAYPGRTFTGQVGKIRLNATMTQNVVTYTVEVNTDNSDGALLPYLTANVRFEVDQRKNVLTVPNPALRWTPSSEQDQPDEGGQVADGQAQRPTSTQEAGGSVGGGSRPRGPGRVWIRDGTSVRPVSVKVGLSDGYMTEIETESLKPGDEVVVGETELENVDQTNNPFAPRFFPGRRRG